MMEIFATYFFMICSLINMVIFLAIAYRTKKLMFLLTAFVWLNFVFWGMTLSAINVEWLRTLNRIVIPIDGGFIGLVAGFMKLEAAIHDKHI